METVVIVIHLMVIVALVAVVLLQRSEGGALGMGGGDQFMTMRGQGNVLTRATTILGGDLLRHLAGDVDPARLNAPPTAMLDTAPAAQTAPAAPTTPNTPATAPTGSDTGRRLQATDAGRPAAATASSTSSTATPAVRPAAVTPKSVVPDTSTPAAPAGSAPADSQAPATSQ